MTPRTQTRWSRAFPLVLGLLLGAFGATLYAQSMPKLPDGLQVPKAADSPGQVTFNHGTHVDADKPSCTGCHPREFPILKASKRTAITHADMEKGKYCGSCHDGKKAFAMDDCSYCHQS